MIPLAAVLVAMPLISFATVKFALVPQIQNAAKGGGAAAAAAPAHPEPAKDAGKDKKDGHGKDEKKDGKKNETGKASKTKDGWQYKFPPVVSNLAGSMGTRYLRCSFTVVSDDARIAELIQENEAKLKDAALQIFGARSQSDLEATSARSVIGSELAARFNKAMETAAVKEVLFTDWVVQ
jgi:flagellar FliL protein